MKTILRNFFSTLRRFKMATLLNLFGLSVAFSTFIIIMIQINYHLEFNSCIPDADHVYRINLIYEGSPIAATPRPIGDGFAAYSPHVKAVAINNAMYATVFDRYFMIDSDDSSVQQQTYAEKMMETTSGYINIFQPEMLEGNAQAFLEPDKVLIPKSMSERLFKEESPIGKRLRGEDFLWTVGGVYKDFPQNSSTHNFILLQMAPHEHWALNYETYISIDSSQDAYILFSEYISTIEPILKSAGFNNVEFFLSPVKALHFETTIGFDTVAKMSKTQLWILISIALIILLIAAINFTNYSIALSPLRVRSLNTQKVLGADVLKLRISLTIEAILVCLTSFGLALFLVHLSSLTSITNLLPSNLTLQKNVALLFIVGGIALLTGFFSGIYPALYTSSFTPTVVLKGNFGLSLRGRRLRSTLVGLQYVVSFVLIVASLFMFIQTKYMQHKNPGYNRGNMIVITTNKQFANQHELFAEKLNSLPSIEAVGYSEALLAGRDHFDIHRGNVKESPVILNVVRADANFLQAMNIPILEGRYFTQSDAQAEEGYFAILNKRARKEYNLQVGDKIDGIITIVGFIHDINYTSFRKEIEPMGFILDPTRRFAYVRTKEGSDIYSAMQEIEKELQALSPGFPFEIHSLDDLSNNSYDYEKNIMILITLFSFLAILLSLIGVFGLVIFEGEYKRKEIGIRKVFGSTTKEILKMLNKKYVYLLIICFIVATPLAYYGVNQWLHNFAYKTPMYCWVFAVTFLLVAALTSITVTFQSWRIANSNPVDSIKTE